MTTPAVGSARVLERGRLPPGMIANRSYLSGLVELVSVHGLATHAVGGDKFYR